MQWKHKVSLGWMKARQHHLTATDIRRLIPYTKSGNKRTISEDVKIEIAASKICKLTDDDCISVGAAARGHLLEPFAIEAFDISEDRSSLLSTSPQTLLLHVDDKVIFNKGDQKTLGLAFSPDAVSSKAHNILYRSCNLEINRINLDAELDSPFCIGEVKCYSPGKHLAIANEDTLKIEERWQIATAMAVCDNIDKAYLILYCPDITMRFKKLFVIEYNRSDLTTEINIVVDTYEQYEKWFYDYICSVNGRALSCYDNIDDIVHRLEEKGRLNP